MSPEHTWEAPATASEISRMRSWAEELCATAGTPGVDCADVVLAVSEAVTNVVMHAYVDRAEPGRMRVRASVCPDRLQFEIEDDGVGIRPRLDSPGAGFGLALIASLAAELEFARSGTGRGARVRMVFAH